MSKILSFEQCLEMAEKNNLKKHILLGNGFSRSFDENFSYYSLTNISDPLLKKLIKQYEYNPEIAMQYVDEYKNKDNIPIKKNDIKKDILNKLIDLHPRSVFSMDLRYIQSCYDNLLRHFDKIYTTNFDLLLYIITLQLAFLTTKQKTLIDGFYNGREHIDLRKFIYRGKTIKSKKASVLYLHGALHIFIDKIEKEYYNPLFETNEISKLYIDDPRTVYRYTSNNNKEFLINQIKVKLETELPLTVFAESTGAKLGEIKQHSYLLNMYDIFSGKTDKTERCLFIFGQSLNNKLDGHLSHAIQTSENIKYIFYGIYSPAFDTEELLQAEMSRLHELLIVDTRNKRKLYFYDTFERDIWGKHIQDEYTDYITPKQNN